jgi:hypothetical protein
MWAVIHHRTAETEQNARLRGTKILALNRSQTSAAIRKVIKKVYRGAVGCGGLNFTFDIAFSGETKTK